MNSVVNGHTNYLLSLCILVEKRRERLKVTAVRNVTNGRQLKNVAQVTATKEGGGTARTKSERQIKRKSQRWGNQGTTANPTPINLSVEHWRDA